MLSRTLAVITLGAALAACGGGSSSPSPVAAAPTPGNPSPNQPDTPLQGDGEIRVLSNRADLISDGDALVEIVAADSSLLEGASVFLNDQLLEIGLVATESGTRKALVTGLSLGSNQLRIVLEDGSVLNREIINHPNGGPVISGPQIQPWQ